MCYHEATGKKVAGEPQGGHFTGFFYQAVYLEYGNGFSITKVGQTSSYTSQSITASVTVNVIWNSTGSFVNLDNTLNASFATIFP
jgi:hypothetical protein